MAELYDMETGMQVPKEEEPPIDPKIHPFYACCGASILAGFYPDIETVEMPYSAEYGEDYKGRTYTSSRVKTPQTFTLPRSELFTLAVTNPSQERAYPDLLKALAEQGYEKIGVFLGQHGYDLTLWGGGPRGRKLKPVLAESEAVKQIGELRNQLETANAENQKLTLREQKMSEELGELRGKLSLRRSLRKGPMRPVSKRVNRTKANQPAKG